MHALYPAESLRRSLWAEKAERDRVSTLKGSRECPSPATVAQQSFNNQADAAEIRCSRLVSWRQEGEGEGREDGLRGEEEAVRVAEAAGRLRHSRLANRSWEIVFP
ncbi:hypothetical protein E2C01_054998 [Portunus trituberculatus]|uniref:Uncharacterized protein n=1 Tax=Portunus trituberculatus TaxID=210409 RepID=A0A5B7GUR8_PORTR|nr:hypothetical protein [Portunus trituberculatus]